MQLIQQFKQTYMKDYDIFMPRIRKEQQVRQFM
jgi:hypothetical protein